MNFTMDETTAKWDGKWHKVYLPLSRFAEGGSWDNAWFNPAGLFDWRAVDRLEIVAEQATLAGKNFWFDNIQVCNQDTAQVYETSTFTDIEQIHADYLKFNVFPNPVYNQATISYSITDSEPVNISLLSLSGQTLETIVDAQQTAGDYNIRWTRAAGIKQGVYICRVAVSDKVSQFKIIVM